jgi:hypothetical protein
MMEDERPRCPQCGTQMAKAQQTDPVEGDTPDTQTFVYCQNPTCSELMRLRPIASG